MEEEIRGWKNLGIVETIYEEEEHEGSSTTLSISTIFSSPPTPLHSTIEAWSLAMGSDADVAIHIQGSSFHLHKDPLVSNSGYLKRQLTESTDITLSPPLNITAETFTLVAQFCYGAHLVITPVNVAALRTAADLLEMTETHSTDGESLRQKTETYFRQAVTVNREYASKVLRSCLLMLPEAETTSCLVSRCIEALSLMDDGDDDIRYLEDVKTVTPNDFQLIAESMNKRLTGTHDLLYRIVDLYLKEHKGEITDEEKARICNYIDCTTLSPQLLMHAVQNPRMPLRFIVQAMFIEQLNTRRTFLSALNHHHHHRHQHHNHNRKHQNKDTNVTLGTILHRDSAVRQVAQLKSTMDSTSSRIQSLERELSGMRKVLNDSENGLDSVKSASFRFSSEGKVERGERGSVSSASFRIMNNRKDSEGIGGTFSSFSPEEFSDGAPRVDKNLGRRFLNGLKSALRVSSPFRVKQESN